MLVRNEPQDNAEERMRPNTLAIIAANPNGPPGTNAGAKFKSLREVPPKGPKLNTPQSSSPPVSKRGKKTGTI